MSDGRTRALRDLRPGDRIYGTRVEGGRRRYVITEVLDHWPTVKPAYRVTLADGTRIVASGDHRFLGERGWRYVSGGGPGAGQGPRLRPGDRLAGTGSFTAPPKEDDDYKRGYLCGILRDDGRGGGVHRLGLAPVEREALDRGGRYLRDLGMHARTPAAVTDELIRWPPQVSDAWRKGFLAGLVDAAPDAAPDVDANPCPGLGRGVLGFSGSDARLLRMLVDCLRHFGFGPVSEHVPGEAAVTVVRLRGGLKERLRLLQLVDPAGTRQRSIEGAAVTSDAALAVTSIEPLGIDLPMFDLTTGTGDFVSNGLVSHNCFARKTHEYLDLDAGADFDSKVVVKVNAAELVRRELAAPRWRGEHIAMGTNVDCYQRAEGRYRLMPGILAALRDAANPFSILTKGSLILRDLPLLLEAGERAEVSTMVSVGSLDRELWRLVEPGTPAPGRRMEVCAALNEAGIGCGVLMGPVLPYLSDSPRELEAVVRAAAEAGATSIGAITLHLRPGAREWYLSWLRDHHPELVVPYARLYGDRAYAPKAYQERISARVKELADQYGIGGRGRRFAGGRAGGGAGGGEQRPAPPAGPQQLTLM
ncbi:hypothetical protein SMC26_43030 [Actinomadura fulvescens]|uniref:Intein-containing Rv2578c family radical SAM protein n=1 Tax=Actinomadura fulvescens TaxID=46160 RepID=A0ABN3PML9_9ACTN